MKGEARRPLASATTAGHTTAGHRSAGYRRFHTRVSPPGVPCALCGCLTRVIVAVGVILSPCVCLAAGFIHVPAAPSPRRPSPPFALHPFTPSPSSPPCLSYVHPTRVPLLQSGGPVRGRARASKRGPRNNARTVVGVVPVVVAVGVAVVVVRHCNPCGPKGVLGARLVHMRSQGLRAQHASAGNIPRQQLERQ